MNQEFHFGILGSDSILPQARSQSQFCSPGASAPSGSQVCAFGMQSTGTWTRFPRDFSDTPPSPCLLPRRFSCRWRTVTAPPIPIVRPCLSRKRDGADGWHRRDENGAPSAYRGHCRNSSLPPQARGDVSPPGCCAHRGAQLPFGDFPRPCGYVGRSYRTTACAPRRQPATMLLMPEPIESSSNDLPYAT